MKKVIFTEYLGIIIRANSRIRVESGLKRFAGLAARALSLLSDQFNRDPLKNCLSVKVILSGIVVFDNTIQFIIIHNIVTV